jgi:hypothetical protein
MPDPDVHIVSFGYGHGTPPEAHLTLDLRHHFRNPHANPTLRGKTFADQSVRKAVLRTPGIRRFLKRPPPSRSWPTGRTLHHRDLDKPVITHGRKAPAVQLPCSRASSALGFPDS